MQTDWAAENLQTIRTLMERTALYRHAMGPVMVAVGVTGLAAGALGAFLDLQQSVGYWMAVAAVCMAAAFLMIRRQALKEAESFWSPPMRRVVQAMLPAFFTGLAAGISFVFFQPGPAHAVLYLAPAWMVLYGLAMHAAGFFMPRGFKLFGSGFVLAGVGAYVGSVEAMTHGLNLSNQTFHWAMGGIFGGAHLAYGIYLQLTEKRGNVS